MKVYLAALDNTYDGPKTTVHQTEEGAWKYLGEYLIETLIGAEGIIHNEIGELIPNPDIFVGEEKLHPLEDPVKFAKSWGRWRFPFRRELFTVYVEEKEVLD